MCSYGAKKAEILNKLFLNSRFLMHLAYVLGENSVVEYSYLSVNWTILQQA